MPILNYTTSIDADKTAMEISACLRAHGAQSVLTEYDPKEHFVTAISFRVPLGEGSIAFRLPCDWRPVLDILKSDPKVPAKLVTQVQAVRVAWRIVKDWVLAQMALIETRMVSTHEAFLPYAIVRDGRTLAETFTANPTRLLEAPK